MLMIIFITVLMVASFEHSLLREQRAADGRVVELPNAERRAKPRRARPTKPEAPLHRPRRMSRRIARHLPRRPRNRGGRAEGPRGIRDARPAPAATPAAIRSRRHRRSPAKFAAPVARPAPPAKLAPRPEEAAGLAARVRVAEAPASRWESTASGPTGRSTNAAVSTVV